MYCLCIAQSIISPVKHSYSALYVVAILLPSFQNQNEACSVGFTELAFFPNIGTSASKLYIGSMYKLRGQTKCNNSAAQMTFFLHKALHNDEQHATHNI